MKSKNWLKRKGKGSLSLLTACFIVASSIPALVSPIPANAQANVKTKTVTFNESTDPSQSQTVTIPNLSKVVGVSVDNGNVSYSQNGNNLTLNVSNGSVSRTQWNPTEYSKTATGSQTSGSQYNFPSSIPYYSDYNGYSGTLTQNGSPYVISGSYTPSASKTGYDSITNGSNYFPSTVYYNQSGYSGTLYQDGGSSSFVVSGQYIPSDWQYVRQPEFRIYRMDYHIFYGGQWHYDYTNPNPYVEPHTQAYNQNGYSGTLNRTVLGDTWLTERGYPSNPYYGEVVPYLDYYVYYDFEGWVLRPTTDTRVWNYTQNYSGTVTKPASDTRVWQQNYAGTVYKGANDNYYKYSVTIQYYDDNTAPTVNLSYNTNPTQEVFVTESATDDNSGVESITLSNGQTLNSSSGTIGITQNGYYTFKATDYSGNVGSKTVYISNIDNQAPNVPTVSADSNWTQGSVPVTITSNGDNGIAGVDHVEYSLSGATNTGWTTYSSPFSVSNEGTTTISARVIDKAGNVSGVSTDVVNIDRTAPSIQSSINPSSWTSGNATISINGTDAGSGVNRIYLPNGNVVYGSNASYTASANGIYNFTIVDNAGNSITKSVVVSQIDRTSPNLSISSENTGWTSGNVTLSASASDGESGLSYITLPDGTKKYSSSATYSATANGRYPFSATDNVGNVTSNYLDVSNIDKTSPTLSLQLNTTGWTNKNVTISAIAGDSQSGVSKIQNPDGTWINGSNSSYTVGADGTYTFNVLDNVGNFTTQSIYVSNIDTVSPQGSASLSTSNWTNQPVTITLNGTDDRSGVKQIQKPDGSIVSTASATYAVSQNGTYHFLLTDNAGNQTDYPVNVSNIDTTAPSTQFQTNPNGWTNGSVTVTATVSDNQSGVKRIQLPNGTWVYSNTTAYIITQNGTYKFVTEDNVGNQKVEQVTIGNIDKEMPTLSLTPNITTYTNQDVTINAIGGDNVSGVSKIQLPNGNWIVGNNASYTVSSNGTYSFNVEDNAGNISSQAITISNIAPPYGSSLVSENIPTVMEAGQTYPVTIIVKNIGKEIWSEANYIRLGAVGDSDPFAPFRQYLGNNVVPFGNTATFTFNMVAPTTVGTYTTDWAMLQEAHSGNGGHWYPTLIQKNVTVQDTLPPNATITPSTTNWVKSETLTATASDSGTGVKRIELPNGTWVNGSVASQTVTSNGTYSFTLEDNAGNQTTKTFQVQNIDQTAPTIIIAQNPTTWTNQPVTLIVNANDGESGVKRIQKPDGTWVNGNIVNVVENGNGTYTFVAEDNVGNQTTKSITISNIDTTPPTSPMIQANANWTNASSVPVTITAGTDSQSGVNHTEYKLDGATVMGWTTYSGAFSISNEGVTQITARTIDNVGQVSAESTGSVKIDKSPPINTSIQIQLK